MCGCRKSATSQIEIYSLQCFSFMDDEGRAIAKIYSNCGDNCIYSLTLVDSLNLLKSLSISFGGDIQISVMVLSCQFVVVCYSGVSSVRHEE